MKIVFQLNTDYTSHSYYLTTYFSLKSVTPSVYNWQSVYIHHILRRTKKVLGLRLDGFGAHSWKRRIRIAKTMMNPVMSIPWNGDSSSPICSTVTFPMRNQNKKRFNEGSKNTDKDLFIKKRDAFFDFIRRRKSRVCLNELAIMSRVRVNFFNIRFYSVKSFFKCISVLLYFKA